MFPEYYLERFPRGTTCRSHRQTASKPQDAVITPWSLKVKARAGNGSGAGGCRWAKREGKKIQVERKRRNHIKKHLKEKRAQAGRRREEEEETGGGWIRKGRGQGCGGGGEGRVAGTGARSVTVGAGAPAHSRGNSAGS